MYWVRRRISRNRLVNSRLEEDLGVTWSFENNGLIQFQIIYDSLTSGSYWINPSVSNDCVGAFLWPACIFFTSRAILLNSASKGCNHFVRNL